MIVGEVEGELVDAVLPGLAVVGTVAADDALHFPGGGGSQNKFDPATHLDAFHFLGTGRRYPGTAGCTALFVNAVAGAGEVLPVSGGGYFELGGGCPVGFVECGLGNVLQLPVAAAAKLVEAAVGDVVVAGGIVRVAPAETTSNVVVPGAAVV